MSMVEAGASSGTPATSPALGIHFPSLTRTASGSVAGVESGDAPSEGGAVGDAAGGSPDGGLDSISDSDSEAEVLSDREREGDFLSGFSSSPFFFLFFFFLPVCRFCFLDFPSVSSPARAKKTLLYYILLIWQH